MVRTKLHNIYIIMYHYIKEKKNNNFANLNYLEFKEFRRQINFLKKNLIF